MRKCDVAVIDYGIGNLLSVRRGLEHSGAKVNVTSDPAEILAAPRVVLPGVGAFANGMENLRRAGISDVVREVAARGTPLFGICLGMQMLLDESEEFGHTAGLGLVPGRVVAVPATTPEGQPQKIPHIGWNGLFRAPARESWQGTVLQDVAEGESVYFVHSYMASPTEQRDALAECRYGSSAVSAAIARENVFGCQFHPEKSGKVGLRILKSFLAL